MKKTRLLGIGIVLILLLSACQPVEETLTPPTAHEGYTYGEDAMVDSLEVILLESFPVQAQVRVSGNLPDGCTELHEITAAQEGQEFILSLTTRRPAGDVMCTEALVPFEETVGLEIQGLEAGTYTVIAQEEQVEFTLDVDNFVQDNVEQAEFDYGANATVEEIALDVMESYPIQVRVSVRGYLPDGCTEIEQISAVRDGTTFHIEIVTRRPAGDVMCTQQIVPFDESLDLAVEFLGQGEYTVQYEELSESFRIE